jgi:hypothetical protein
MSEIIDAAPLHLRTTAGSGGLSSAGKRKGRQRRMTTSWNMALLLRKLKSGIMISLAWSDAGTRGPAYWLGTLPRGVLSSTFNEGGRLANLRSLFSDHRRRGEEGT